MLLHPEAKAPTRSNEYAVGYDIHCVAGTDGIDMGIWGDNKEQLAEWQLMAGIGEVTLLPGTGFLFRTGFAQAIQPGYACLFWDRSGMGGKKMVHRLAGAIDEDYRGEWFVRLVNHSDKGVTIKNGDRIVQGVYQERIEAEFPLTNQLPESGRGAGGFGSTGT